MAAGIYIHIPFCLRKCPYCDFYSLAFDSELCSHYLDAVIDEARQFPSLACDTVYFGGGTPSLLSAAEIARVLDSLAGYYSISNDAEITLECNPATVDEDTLVALRSAGINRLSVGVQSLDDDVLKKAGRLHSSAEALKTLSDAHAAGFDNISADLMIGLPGEDRSALKNTVMGLSRAGVSHISAYMLKLMPGTPFYEHIPDNLPDDDGSAEFYESCCGYLDAAGFEQYEISNFARSYDSESRHNRKYWACGEWIGLGAAAHSCVADDRFSFGRDINGFIKKFKHALPNSTGYLDALTHEGAIELSDRIMLGLRTREGIDIEKLREEYNYTLNQQNVEFINSICDAGLARYDKKNLSLTRGGMLVSNSIIARLI